MEDITEARGRPAEATLLGGGGGGDGDGDGGGGAGDGDGGAGDGDDAIALAEDAQFDRMLVAEAEPGLRTPYGPRPDQFLEWFGDPSTAGTIVVLIHGGYFREQYTLSYMRPMAKALVDSGAGSGVETGAVRNADSNLGAGGGLGAGLVAGMDQRSGVESRCGSVGSRCGSSVAVALVEYRRAGGEGGHPRTLDDVEQAMVYVSAVAAGGESGLSQLQSGDVRARDEKLSDETQEDMLVSAARLVVAGHSAGGSLALSWATRQPKDGPNVSVRPLSAVTDLVAEVRDNLGDGAVLEYMGATPDEDRGRYLAEDPRSRAVLIPPRIDVQLIHGVEDRTVNIAFPRGFPAKLWELDGAHHFDVVDSQSQYFDEVTRFLMG